MSDLPSEEHRIQTEETRFRFAVSESVFQKVGKTINFLLDGYRIPVGTINYVMIKETDCPAGWDIADGREVSRTGVYANLYAKSGFAGGPGNGTTTWNLPDLRGVVLRGVAITTEGDRGNDLDGYARTVAGGGGLAADAGSYQDDEFKQHTHHTGFQAGGSGSAYQSVGNQADGQVTGPAGGTETRMKNVYAMPLIKL